MSVVPGTASDPVMVARVQRAERENRDFAMLWRRLTRTDCRERDGEREEELRRTARAAVQDWLEACP